MEIVLKKFDESHIDGMVKIWNDVVIDGIAFPQEETLDYNSGKGFFNSQSYCGVAVNKETDEVMGMYILHPNNIGRCGHIANASYCVGKNSRTDILLYAFSTVIQRDFCSHALTDCLYAFIHLSFRYGSKCGSRYESKCLLSLFHVSLSVICLMLSFDLQCINV